VKEYILVVDDEHSLRQFLEIFLEKEGYEVDTAASLEEAEQAIGRNVYDLVLTTSGWPARTTASRSSARRSRRTRPPRWW
jgi:DNA-binding response OmpR family regulator